MILPSFVLYPSQNKHSVFQVPKVIFLYFTREIFSRNKMISAKKLIKLARKWQKMAAIRPKKITLPQPDTSRCSTSTTAEKGHFVVYSADQKRFLLPLNYLNNEIVQGLLKLAEEEFGLPSSGHLTLPCDAKLMEYAIALIEQRVTRDVEKALLMSMASSHCSTSKDLHHQETCNQLSIFSF